MDSYTTSSGKSYNGEKAIISLTSWRARINTVGKTLYSLLTQCPDFHIVLVLSEEEFPKKEKELPDSLMSFVNNNLIELLWVYKNYRAFKKVLFTLDKYRTVPVISADDDCIYTCNYAEELYQKWLQTNYDGIIVYDCPGNLYTTEGQCTLYSPEIGQRLTRYFFNREEIMLTKLASDGEFKKFFLLNRKIHLTVKTVDTEQPFYFHTAVSPISPRQLTSPFFNRFFKYIR